MTSTKLKEAGADWLTAVSTSEQSAVLMADLWHDMLDEYGIPTRWREKQTWFGYDGTRVEHAFYGVREEQALIRLSGPMAYNHANAFLEVGARPSRYDVQLTGVVDNASQQIQRMYEQACNFKPITGRPASVKAFLNRNRAFEGLYVGRRQSETFVRVYDKYEESKQPEYKDCLRVEVELKAGTARSLAGLMMQATYKTTLAQNAVASTLQKRGVTLPWEIRGEDVVFHKTTGPTPIESKAAWLRQQVSPTIQAMLDEIGYERVWSLLFPDSLDKHADSAIMD